MLKLYRLVDRNEAKYRMEFCEVDQGSARIEAWWALPETVSIVAIILPGEKEDARYERPGLDWARVPATWPRRKAMQLITDTEGEAARVAEQIAKQQVPAVEVEGVGPTLFNDEPVAPPQVQENGDQLVCPCCMVPIPVGGWDAEARSDARSPSGRLDAYKCMHCGRDQHGMPRRMIAMQYHSMQLRYSAIHKQRVKPASPFMRWR